MGPGTQLIAPEGCGALLKGTTYYLLANYSFWTNVLLTWFEPGPLEWRAYFLRLSKSEFEAGLLARSIVEVDSPITLPPWLKRFEGLNPEAIELTRVSKKKTYIDRVQKHLDHIDKLLEDLPGTLATEDLQGLFRDHAADCKPKQHPHRVALWLAVYVAYSRNRWALLPASLNSGHWDRATSPSITKKLGRPSKTKGKHAGHSAVPLAAAIRASYEQRASVGVTMPTIHAAALTKDFGCKVGVNERGLNFFFHPEGKAFPTEGQFAYHVSKAYGINRVLQVKLGDIGYRSRKAASLGRFSEACSNLLERTETDVYYVEDLPRSLLDDGPALPLAVAKLVDVMSGADVAIGFSYGSETAEAYRMMLFCAAVPKPYFCRLLGMTVTSEELRCEGFPLAATADRGPGSSGKVADKEEANLPDRSTTPSWTPQSKGTVESSHPRTPAIAGAPSYFQSDLNVIEIARREIRRMILNNQTSDASPRLTPDMVAAGVPANPNGFWTYMYERGRTDGTSMRLDDAIRAFLTPTEFTLNRDGLWHLATPYDSDELRATGVHDRVARSQQAKLTGFSMGFCTRYTWVEINGRLIEVEAKLPIRDDEEQLYMTLAESTVHAAKKAALRHEQIAHRPAAKAKAEADFEADVGKTWDGGERKAARKPSRASRRSAKIPTPKARQRPRRS